MQFSLGTECNTDVDKRKANVWQLTSVATTSFCKEAGLVPTCYAGGNGPVLGPQREGMEQDNKAGHRYIEHTLI